MNRNTFILYFDVTCVKVQFTSVNPAPGSEEMTVDSNAKETSKKSTQSIQELEKHVQQLQSQILVLQKSVEALEKRLLISSGRYIATCPNCQTRFDMLAHHYSIGLFDNLVYVKCPKCHKALPVKGGSSGEVAVVSDCIVE